MTIPTDHVDDEQLARPSHWDIALHPPVHALLRTDQLALRLRSPSRSCSGSSTPAAALFRSGWFVESLATQTLVVFVIRTRRVPFFRSRPSRPLLISVIVVVVVGRPCSRRARSPTPSASIPLPPAFFAVLVVLRGRLPLARRGREAPLLPDPAHHRRTPLRRRHTHRIQRIAARWSHDASPAPATQRVTPRRQRAASSQVRAATRRQPSSTR